MLDQRRIAATFVELADTLVDGFDTIDMLHTLTERCVELLEVDDAAVLLADRAGALQLVAASTEQTRLLELVQLRNREGPCLDCYRTGQPVASTDLAAETERWPHMALVAGQCGFVGAQAIPLRLRTQICGVLGLFRSVWGPLPTQTVDFARSLADIATISILHAQAFQRFDQLGDQLNRVIGSRITIEQTKGYLAERIKITVSEAFILLRAYAHDRRLRLTELAQAVVTGRVTATELLTARPPQ